MEGGETQGRGARRRGVERDTGAWSETQGRGARRRGVRRSTFMLTSGMMFWKVSPNITSTTQLCGSQLGASDDRGATHNVHQINDGRCTYSYF